MSSANKRAVDAMTTNRRAHADLRAERVFMAVRMILQAGRRPGLGRSSPGNRIKCFVAFRLSERLQGVKPIFSGRWTTHRRSGAPISPPTSAPGTLARDRYRQTQAPARPGSAEAPARRAPTELKQLSHHSQPG